MGRVVPCSLAELPGLIERDLSDLDRRVKVGMGKAAIDGAHAIEPNLPVAFGDLRRSLHVDADQLLAGIVRIVLDAPHAVPLEQGSAPHTPPLEPLIKWVKLRGMQGIYQKSTRGAVKTTAGDIRSPGRKAWGNTTAANAHSIAVALKQVQSVMGITDIDAPVKIARAIQASIRKHGTRPHWMVRSTLPKIETTLGKRMREAVKKDS